ncbi:hypothetical protein Tco_0019778, partial [Tanacetum coccineum]
MFLHIRCLALFLLSRFGSLSHLKDVIVGGLKIQKLYQEHLESTTTTDIRPIIAEYDSSWWIRSPVFFRQHVPKALVIEHHSLYETYLLKIFFVEDELRLCLEDEERMLLKQEKNIIEEQRFRVEEAKRMSILGKLTHSKRNHVDIVPGKTNPTDLSCLFHLLDTVWLTLDVERFISQQGHVKCKFPWSDDYTVGRNFWLTLACLDPCRKGWLSEELDILSGLVTFYDSGDTYDYEWRDWYVRVHECLQDYGLEKCRELMKSISETQLKERLPVILLGAKVFDKKRIDPTNYCIRFKLADSVPKQGGIFGDCGVWVCIFLYQLAHGLSLDVEDTFDVAL